MQNFLIIIRKRKKVNFWTKSSFYFLVAFFYLIKSKKSGKKEFFLFADNYSILSLQLKLLKQQQLQVISSTPTTETTDQATPLDHVSNLQLGVNKNDTKINHVTPSSGQKLKAVMAKINKEFQVSFHDIPFTLKVFTTKRFKFKLFHFSFQTSFFFICSD